MVASQVAERTVSRLMPDLAPSLTEGREEHSSSACGVRQSAGHVTSHESGSVFKTCGKTGPPQTSIKVKKRSWHSKSQSREAFMPLDEDWSLRKKTHHHQVHNNKEVNMMRLTSTRP